MESYSKKNAAKLGARIAFVFLIAVCVLAFTAYVILSNNFQNLFMDYTIQLVQSMYVICYSSPIFHDDKVIGAFSA